MPIWIAALVGFGLYSLTKETVSEGGVEGVEPPRDGVGREVQDTSPATNAVTDDGDTKVGSQGPGRELAVPKPPPKIPEIKTAPGGTKGATLPVVSPLRNAQVDREIAAFASSPAGGGLYF